MPDLDPAFTDLFLRFLVSDRLMLSAVGGMVDPRDFEDRSERVIASLAVDHWREYQEPISSFLRIEVGDYIEGRATRNKPLRPDAKTDLLKLTNSILKQERPLIAATKVQKMFQKFKTEQFMRRSMDEVLELQMAGELNIARFGQIAQKCSEYSISQEFVARNYTEELEERISRREAGKDRRYPLFYIDPLDERVRAPGRKEMGLFLAPYKSGKSMALLYMALTLARQRYNVLHISLEDTSEILESRLDSMIADLPINQIAELSGELRERFYRAVKRYRNRIKLIDAVGQDLSVEQIDGIYERERSKGWVSDGTIVDYDEKLMPPQARKDKRFEIDDTYRAFQNYLGRRQQIGWIASQVGRKGEKKRIISGDMAAEDIGKVRKATVAIGIGWGEAGDNNKYLYIAGHKDGADRWGTDIMVNYKNGLFYDRDATLRAFGKQSKAAVKVGD